MRSRFHEAAEAEVTEAVDFYDAKAQGLGDRFLGELKTATKYIEEYPEIGPVIDQGVRAKILAKFPYSIMYVIEEDRLFIVAVAHQSRRPAYWADRLS